MAGSPRTVPPAPGRGAATRLGMLAAALVVLAVALLVLAPADRAVRRTPGAGTPGPTRAARWRDRVPRAQLTVAERARSVPVPDSFLGLSTEYWALPRWTRRASMLDRVLSLLRVPGGGPLVLRIGGDSADEAFWEPRLREDSDWVIELTSSWLKEARALVRSSDVRLILDLNLVTATPAIAAQWARAAETALPSRSIAGFEIGNEPDLYDRRYWLSIVSGTALGEAALPRALTAPVYARDFRSYADALSAAAPGVALMGPAIANPSRHLNWISGLLAGSHLGLRTVSAHRYLYSACALPGSQAYPTISRLLGERATAGMAQALRSDLRIVHRAGMAFRLTELNSVTCGGLPGVSDTFATALWAPDALFELLRAGVDGVNVHVRPRTFNAAFSLGDQGLTVHPLFYGLLLFSRALGVDSRLVPVSLRARRSPHLKAWAVEVRGNTLHVLLINKGSRAVTVALNLPAEGPATVQRLLAPSVSSRSGVTLNGRQLNAEGNWVGRSTIQTITPAVNGYGLGVPRLSAALVSVRLAPRALTRSPAR